MQAFYISEPTHNNVSRGRGFLNAEGVACITTNPPDSSVILKPLYVTHRWLFQTSITRTPPARLSSMGRNLANQQSTNDNGKKGNETLNSDFGSDRRPLRASIFVSILTSGTYGLSRSSGPTLCPLLGAISAATSPVLPSAGVPAKGCIVVAVGDHLATEGAKAPEAPAGVRVCVSSRDCMLLGVWGCSFVCEDGYLGCQVRPHKLHRCAR